MLSAKEYLKHYFEKNPDQPLITDYAHIMELYAKQCIEEQIKVCAKAARTKVIGNHQMDLALIVDRHSILFCQRVI